MISIREAKLQDLPELRQLAIDIYQYTFEESNTPENMEAFLLDSYNLETIVREFQESNTKLYLACNGERIAGFLRLRVTDEANKYLGNNNLELHRLYIDRDFQGQKIGQNLMELALDYAKEHKFDWIWLGVWEKNYKAQKFYEMWGFERFSEHIFQMGDDAQTDWLLKKRININHE